MTNVVYGPPAAPGLVLRHGPVGPVESARVMNPDPAGWDEAILGPRDVCIWQKGHLLAIGHDRGFARPRRPLAPEVHALLTAPMEYRYVEFLRGADQFRSADGARRRVRTTRTLLWQPDPADGVLVCQAGYLARVVRALSNLGYNVRYWRADPPRAAAFELDLARVARYYRFRPGQEECFEILVNRVLAGLGGVVDASVGFGKSDLIAPLCMAFPKAKVVVAVRRLDAVSKTVRQLRRYLPSVGQVGGGKDEERHRVTVYSLDSFGHFQGDADIAFFDEAHEVLAPHYAEVVAARLDRAIPIALTATTNARADGADARMEPLFGETVFFMPYPRAVQLGLVVPIRVVVHPVTTATNPVAGLTDDTARKRHGIWRNAARNRIIADAAKAVPEGTQCLILVATMDHLVRLHQLLPDYVPVWAESSNEKGERYAARGLWPDFEKMTAARRQRLREQFEEGAITKAIATIWDQAVSFDRLQVLIWAKGGQAKLAANQGPGRVSRIDPATKKAYGEVHDFSDDFDSGMHDAWLRRARHYAQNEWSIASAGDF